MVAWRRHLPQHMERDGDGPHREYPRCSSELEPGGKPGAPGQHPFHLRQVPSPSELCAIVLLCESDKVGWWGDVRNGAAFVRWSLLELLACKPSTIRQKHR